MRYAMIGNYWEVFFIFFRRVSHRGNWRSALGKGSNHWLAQWLEGDVFGTIEVVERGGLGQYYHLFLFISSEKWRGLISLNHSALFVLCNCFWDTFFTPAAAGLPSCFTLISVVCRHIYMCLNTFLRIQRIQDEMLQRVI